MTYQKTMTYEHIMPYAYIRNSHLIVCAHLPSSPAPPPHHTQTIVFLFSRSSRRDSKTLSLHSNSEFERSRRSPRDLKDGYGEYSTRTYTYSAIRDPRDSLVDPRDSLIDSPSLSQISSLASRR